MQEVAGCKEQCVIIYRNQIKQTLAVVAKGVSKQRLKSNLVNSSIELYRCCLLECDDVLHKGHIVIIIKILLLTIRPRQVRIFAY